MSSSPEVRVIITTPELGLGISSGLLIKGFPSIFTNEIRVSGRIFP